MTSLARLLPLALLLGLNSLLPGQVNPARAQSPAAERAELTRAAL